LRHFYLKKAGVARHGCGMGEGEPIAKTHGRIYFRRRLKASMKLYNDIKMPILVLDLIFRNTIL
jgi:hypothetical protein